MSPGALGDAFDAATHAAPGTLAGALLAPPRCYCGRACTDIIACARGVWCGAELSQARRSSVCEMSSGHGGSGGVHEAAPGMARPASPTAGPAPLASAGAHPYAAPVCEQHVIVPRDYVPLALSCSLEALDGCLSDAIGAAGRHPFEAPSETD